MDTQLVHPLDFLKMFDEATKLEQERTSNRANAFERKRNAILTKIQMLEKKSITIVEEFLSTV